MPAIKKSPDELKNAGWVTLEAIRSYGTEQIAMIRSYVTNQVERASSTPYAQAVLKTVDTAVDLTDHAIDQYLPPSEEELKENEANGEKVNGGPLSNDSSEQNLERLAQKVTYLSGKVRRRLPSYDLGVSRRVLGLIRSPSVPSVSSN